MYMYNYVFVHVNVLLHVVVDKCIQEHVKGTAQKQKAKLLLCGDHLAIKVCTYQMKIKKLYELP